MNYFIFHCLVLLTGSLKTEEVIDIPRGNDSGVVHSAVGLYDYINWNGDRPTIEAFSAAIEGYSVLQDSLRLFDKSLLTIIDFSKPSNEERLWIVNLESREAVLRTLVAHGRNSGEINPSHFSNKVNSLQSSLGFYRTGKTYIGKHGLSLKLHGVESGINDQAEVREIVIHGADYVSKKYIARNGRLGRSHGCPAVPMDIHRQMIRMIQNNTCLFIYYPEREYFEMSNLFKGEDHNTLFAFIHTQPSGEF